MARHVIFTAPDGQEHADPDARWLTDLITSGTDAYWASGTGDASLRFLAEGQSYAEMIMVIRDAYGALVHHLFNSESQEYVMSEPELGVAEVTVKHGGNNWSLPRAFYVDRKRASLAVRQFLENGTRVEGGNWVKF